MSMRNALTFDIEEYFHAEAFARTVRAKASAWKYSSMSNVRALRMLIVLRRAPALR